VGKSVRLINNEKPGGGAGVLFRRSVKGGGRASFKGADERVGLFIGVGSAWKEPVGPARQEWCGNAERKDLPNHAGGGMGAGRIRGGAGGWAEKRSWGR